MWPPPTWTEIIWICNPKSALQRVHPHLLFGPLIMVITSNMSVNCYIGTTHKHANTHYLSNISTSVDWPSLIGCLWPNTYLYLHHMCFILSDLKQALEIILEVQMKRSNQNISFQVTKHVYFYFFSMDPSYFQIS